jgi:hypothetical protein
MSHFSLQHAFYGRLVIGGPLDAVPRRARLMHKVRGRLRRHARTPRLCNIHIHMHMNSCACPPFFFLCKLCSSVVGRDSADFDVGHNGQPVCRCRAPCGGRSSHLTSLPLRDRGRGITTRAQKTSTRSVHCLTRMVGIMGSDQPSARNESAG